MRYILMVFILFSFAFADAIDVVKKVDSIPTVALEDGTGEYDEKIKSGFFNAFLTDLNVLSLFNVDKNYRRVDYAMSSVAMENKNASLVFRYRLLKDVGNALKVELKVFEKGELIQNKVYKINNSSAYMFLSHNIAYDVNQFMGEPPVEWIRKKVIFSRMVSSKKSEIVISDYSLSYQHVIVKNGFNTFPKWANKEQSGFYYTSMDERKPTLKYINIQTAKIKNIKSSDGMMVCSDVSQDGTKLLLTMAPDGQPDVYEFDTMTGESKRITKYSGIDVNGQFLGNDKIVFVSDRLGYPNIFEQEIATGRVSQLAFDGKNNSSCTVFGDLVVYKARESAERFGRNTFNLHMFSTKTDHMRRITMSGENEFPKFSSDGDAILFIKTVGGEHSLGLYKLKQDKSYSFVLKAGRIQSIDW